MKPDNVHQAGFDLRAGPEGVVLVLIGTWLMRVDRPDAAAALEGFGAGGAVGPVRFDTSGLDDWDTALLVWVQTVRGQAARLGLECELDGLPEGARRMLALAMSAPEQEAESEAPTGFFEKLGLQALVAWRAVEDYLEFMGQLMLDLVAFFRGRGTARLKDFLFILQQTGVQALPIVALLSFLTGLIIAFIGVIQLQKFAADIYVADLVGLATTRELGAVMAGVIMAGRTGAAFAAQIGSMQVNEEVDALVTFGISPMRFLVVPRVVALVLMMPLLCACADFVSIFGGMVVAMSISDVSAVQYFYQVEAAVDLNDLMGGIFKSGVFGAIIALSGCYRGLNCGRDATAVGLAATSAVVTSITWIVVADAIFAVMFHILGI
ncbi:MlaE family ABC transporter permease [Coraliomargarita parva]|uniref:MlaE family ABC transporter permease n=1 Tax=Coraliomargarita parva TaxID=3014050 RepID=UPI0022B49238|nr:ABC transporter permease [Coraliomargarita parva]